MNICLFGGSFDPVHSGHLAIAQAAIKAADLQRILFLPAACSPFKTGRQHYFSDAQRLELLRAATASMPEAEVSELDLTMPPPSWSWRVVEACLSLYPGDKLFWLMGTDQWEQLHRWARYDYLCQHLTFIVYHRGTAPQPRVDVNAIFIAGQHPASSSAIRTMIQQGENPPQEWIPAGIDSYPASI